MYPIVLTLHSWLRWPLVFLSLGAVILAIYGWSQARAWTRGTEWLNVAYIAVLDLQVFFGLWLYLFLSPLARRIMQDPVAVMGDGQARFWSAEHIFFMMVSLALAHVGRAWSKNSREAVVQHRRAASLYVPAVLVMLAAIPWPFLEVGRPLLRLPW